MGAENEIVVVAPDGAVVARWTLGARPPDLSAIDELARLRLCARRTGHTVKLHNPSTELCELLELTGLRLDDPG